MHPALSSRSLQTSIGGLGQEYVVMKYVWIRHRPKFLHAVSRLQSSTVDEGQGRNQLKQISLVCRQSWEGEPSLLDSSLPSQHALPPLTPPYFPIETPLSLLPGFTFPKRPARHLGDMICSHFYRTLLSAGSQQHRDTEPSSTPR